MTDVKAAAERVQAETPYWRGEDVQVLLDFALSRLDVADDEMVAELRREFEYEGATDGLKVLNRLTAAEAKAARAHERYKASVEMGLEEQGKREAAEAENARLKEMMRATRHGLFSISNDLRIRCGQRIGNQDLADEVLSEVLKECVIVRVEP